jgi:hypothetical protein
MMLKALLPFPVGTYLSTLFGSIYSCSRKTSRSNYSLRFLEVLVSGTIKHQSTDHGGCSTFSVASDIQEGTGIIGEKN